MILRTLRANYQPSSYSQSCSAPSSANIHPNQRQCTGKEREEEDKKNEIYILKTQTTPVSPTATYHKGDKKTKYKADWKNGYFWGCSFKHQTSGKKNRHTSSRFPCNRKLEKEGRRQGFLAGGFKREADFVGCFLETLGVDACAEADLDSRAEGLDVGDGGDT